MKIALILAAVVMALGLTATNPAQARMVDPGLAQAAPSTVQEVQWRRWRHRHCWRNRWGRLRCHW